MINTFITTKIVLPYINISGEPVAYGIGVTPEDILLFNKSACATTTSVRGYIRITKLAESIPDDGAGGRRLCGIGLEGEKRMFQILT